MPFVLRRLSARLRSATLGSAVLSLSLVVGLVSCSPPADRSSGAAISDGGIGSIEAVEGEGFVLRAQQRSAAAVEAKLLAGDELETGKAGKIRVRLADASILAIGAGTRIALSDLLIDSGNRTGQLDLVAGKFWMQVTKWTGAGTSRWEITTPNAVAGIRGTTLWGDTEVDAICALEGSIEVRSLKDKTLAPAQLSAGSCAASLSQGKLDAMMPSPEEIEGYLDAVLIRD